jgi:hypothetical protein
LSCNPLESCQNGFCLPSLPPFPLVTTGSQLERITRDQQGNIYVIGHFSGSDSLDTISLTSAGSTDILVAKFDRTGTLQWAEQAGGPAQDEGYGIAVSHTGHIFITGRFKGTASFGSTLLTSGSDFDLFVGKLDANGNWLWAKAAGGASSLIDTANAVGVDTNGNAIITGSISQTAIFGSTTLTGTGTRMFVAQIDANGNWKWAISSSHTTGTSQGNQIAVTSGGGSFIAGQFDGTATFGSSTLTSAGNTDAFVAQLDANGAFQWVRQGSSTANVIARDITRQPNGSIAITGTFEGNAVLGGTTLTHLGNKDLFVALLQPNGALQWARAAGGSGAEDSPSITTDTDGYIYVSGQFTGNAIFGLSLPNTLTAQGSSDIFVAKWDSTGTFLTVKQAGGSGIDTAKSMTTDAFGNVIAAGTFGGTANFDGTSRTATGSSDLYLWRTTLVTPAGTKASGTSQEFASGIAVSPDGEACVIGLLQGTVSFGTSSIISNGRDDGWVAKVDSNGAFKWVRRIGGNTLNDRALGVTTDLQGNCYITGYFQDIAAFGSTTLTSTSGQSDVFVAKLDKAGIYQWATQATGNGFKQGKQIALGPNGNLYITGSFLNTATFGTTTLTAAGSFDAFVASLSANGSFQWAKRAGGVADDRGRGIAVDASGDVVICGWFNGTGTFGTITTNATSNDLFVAKLSSTGTFQWVSKSTLSGATLSHQLTTDSNDDIYIAGYFTGTSAWGSTTLTSAGGNDGFLTKLSNTGTFQWTKAMTSTGNVETTGTNIDANSNIVVSGFFNGTMTIGGTTETSTNTDAFIGRFDTNGNLQWTLFSKGAGGETLHGVGTDFFGRLFGVGSFSGTTTVGPHSLTASGSDDILVWLTQP